MLTIEMHGKTVSAADNKIPMKINGNDIEVERVGDTVYVNRMAINLVIVEPKSRVWVKAGYSILGLGSLAAAGYLAYINQEWLITNVPVAVEYLFDYIATTTSNIVGFVTGLLGSGEPAVVPTDVTGQ